jgi:Ca2+-binding EF-hand superfamily protein
VDAEQRYHRLTSKLPASRLYDLDQDGCISAQELFSMLQQIVGEGVTDQQLERVVQATMLQYDTDGDWCLDFQEFVALMNRCGAGQAGVPHTPA